MIETATSVGLLVIGYLIATSAKDVIRLLISLELMFSAVFLSVVPLFTNPSLIAEGNAITLITVFTSAGELLIMISAIIFLDRKFRKTTVDVITTGGDEL
ncbi:NADH-quinone oxidoreductase subunit K [Geoglobus acetivorans]|uniref:F420H2-quinone oxidoreductase, subunit K n=1 Tax=Geoglobus acetivorans TaxID=565033 RepID=A0A0A7GAM1_GEOAI|nr:F420H2-quinone oxidoreductase, subunit K [Geoglobus acetivorans]